MSEEMENAKTALSESAGSLASEEARMAHTIGDKIAKSKGYESLSGRDALQYYLIQTYHWTPSQVKSMSDAQLVFAVEEEKFD